MGRFKYHRSLLDVVEAAKVLREEGASVYFDETIMQAADDETQQAIAKYQIADGTAMQEKPDLCVVLGGDGTFLGAARKYAPQGCKLVGINLGYLGFLTDIAHENMVNALLEVYHGKGWEESRYMLSVDVNGGLVGSKENAVNDVVISRGQSGVLLRLRVSVNGAYVYELRADGLIVSTPSGSTAYALSAGGPIISPNLNAVLLVPLCPHALSHRPLVINADYPIRIDVLEANKSALHIDGHIDFGLDSGDWVEITRDSVPFNICHPPNYDYYQTLRKKLAWGS